MSALCKRCKTPLTRSAPYCLKCAVKIQEKMRDLAMISGRPVFTGSQSKRWEGPPIADFGPHRTRMGGKKPVIGSFEQLLACMKHVVVDSKFSIKPLEDGEHVLSLQTLNYRYQREVAAVAMNRYVADLVAMLNEEDVGYEFIWDILVIRDPIDELPDNVKKQLMLGSSEKVISSCSITM